MSYTYKTRYVLRVSYNGTTYTIVPVDTVTFRTRTNKEIRDSISAGNIQKIHQWPRYTFDIKTSAYAKNLAILYWLQNYNKDFEMIVTEEADDESGSDVKLKNVHLTGCSIEDIQETVLTNDVPGISISGISTGRSSGLETSSGNVPYSFGKSTSAETQPTTEDS
ncbi:MAG: hypothetical protein ACTSQ8_09280 [Candidatus Helarchaeota archaeon]